MKEPTNSTKNYWNSWSFKILCVSKDTINRVKRYLCEYPLRLDSWDFHPPPHLFRILFWSEWVPMNKGNFFGILNSLQPAYDTEIQGSEKIIGLVFGNNSDFISTSISE